MKENIKEKIINETIKLIEEKGSNPDNITIRDICSRVGIGAGLVNYHFQTKENLIRLCVQKIIDNVIKQYHSVYETLDGMAPMEKLRFMAKSTCTYLATHENISRISILTDMTSTNENDNTAGTVAAFFPLFRRVCPTEITDDEVKKRVYLMALTFQSVFLRSALLKKEIDFDFQNEQQRGQLVDKIIDSYIKP